MSKYAVVVDGFNRATGQRTGFRPCSGERYDTLYSSTGVDPKSTASYALGLYIQIYCGPITDRKFKIVSVDKNGNLDLNSDIPPNSQDYESGYKKGMEINKARTEERRYR